ncbi:MAG: competence/damage-inducible protein A [Myxococcota bacterium]
MTQRTAAALIIGNEVLTGKVQEANVAHLAKALFSLGIELRRVIVCPDEIPVIAEDLNALRAAHDLVFTSGGVGPTHDDVTVEAVAHAFGREVIRSAEIERLLRRYHEGKGQTVTEAHLRLANVVEGARLLRNAEVVWPTLVLENVFVLPGVPEIFRLKLTSLRSELERGDGFISAAVFTGCDEGSIARALEDLAYAHPKVTIGSYLKWPGSNVVPAEQEYRVKVTFDGLEENDVRAAADAFVATLADADFRWREGPGA